MNITVIERRPQVGGIHRGDSLLPKVTSLLQAWGLRDAIEAVGARAIQHMEIHTPDGRHVFQAPISGMNATFPYFVLPHARLEAVLMDKVLQLPNVHVIRPASVVDILRMPKTQQACGVRVRQAGVEKEITCRCVIAADGQYSVMRKRAGIAFDAYRYDHAYLGLEADRPPHYQDAMRLHFHAEGGALLMPHPGRIGVGVLVEAGSARHWLGMDEATLSAHLVQRAPILRGMALHMQGAHVYELIRAHAPQYLKDGIILIGDAAHCTNPTAGQGMSMAMLDASALAAAIGKNGWQSQQELDHSVLCYQAKQWPVNQHLVRNSHRLALAYALRGKFWTHLKLLGIRVLSHAMLQNTTTNLIAKFTDKTD